MLSKRLLKRGIRDHEFVTGIRNPDGTDPSGGEMRTLPLSFAPLHGVSPVWPWIVPGVSM
jgi:hypothetical protein